MDGRKRKGKRALVIAVVLGVMAFGAIKPPPARASTGTTLLIAGAAVAAWVVVIIGVTYYIYGNEPEADAFLSGRPPGRDGARAQRLRFGRDCMRLAGNPASVCW